MTRLPTLGAVVPLYGEVSYIRACLDSLLSLTQPFDEVVLVDDATGNVDLAALVEQFCSASTAPVHTLFLESNLGIVGATNIGIEVSNSEFIAFIDCDDVLHPSAAQVFRRYLQDNPDTDLVASRYATFSDDVEQARDGGLFDLQGLYPSPLHLISEHMYLSHLKVASRSFLAKIGGFKSGTDGVQDWHLAMDAVEGGCVGTINEVLYFHRLHNEQTTHTYRAAFMRSVNERRSASVPAQQDRHGIVDELTPDLIGVLNLLRRGDHYSDQCALMFAGFDGRLEAYPASVPWWDVVAARQPEWMLYCGDQWLDLGATMSGLRPPGSPLIGILADSRNPTSVHMTRWYSGYLDFVLLADGVVEAVLYDYIPANGPRLIGTKRNISAS